MATSKTNQTWAEQLASSLTKAATEIGNFQVQLALGKAEARDEYEKLKKNLRAKVHGVTGKIAGASKKHTDNIQSLFDDLRVQLALGKADSRDEFLVQKRKILSALTKLDAALSALPHDSDFRMSMRNEIEKVRIKLDILRLHYRFSEMNAESTGKRITDLKDRVSKMKDNATFIEEIGKVEREIDSAYNHLKKAFA